MHETRPLTQQPPWRDLRQHPRGSKAFAPPRYTGRWPKPNSTAQENSKNLLTFISPLPIICTVTQASNIGCCGIPGVPPASFFKALCEPTRLSITMQLAQSEESKTVSEIAAAQTVDLSVVSRHLKGLREAGVLISQKRGKEMHYAVNAKGLANLLREFANVIEQCPCYQKERT